MKFLLPLFLLFISASIFAQTDSAVYYKNGTTAAREKFYNNAIKNSIQKKLAIKLTTDSEEDWEDAFYTIQLLNYNPSLVLPQISKAAKQLSKQSISFQKSFWTLCYKRFPIRFFAQAKNTIDTTKDFKLMALAGEYILADNKKLNYAGILFKKIDGFIKSDTALKTNAFLISLAANSRYALGFAKETLQQRSLNLLKFIPDFLVPNYLPNNTIVFSFQRKNRNYPGLAIVRKQDGSFVKNEDGSYFNVQQLARSVNNLPSYLTSGNTPQGVFRMSGYGISKIEAIGVTENLQLTLPVESSKQHYFKDSLIVDNNWTIEDYQKILPKNWRKNLPLYEAYFAGLAGRNEIIAHGTTVNPEFYKNQPYYPHTPTEGCLCTKEIWSTVDGKRLQSNQQKLINAVKQAGGAEGYLIVIELEDINKPVTIADILPYLNQIK
ncbi:MAG: hypothetical protein KA319_05675 [Ferruginibacter sp.]|nr:hypothetical protein [Ferruginibacter sp.]